MSGTISPFPLHDRGYERREWLAVDAACEEADILMDHDCASAPDPAVVDLALDDNMCLREEILKLREQVEKLRERHL